MEMETRSDTREQVLGLMRVKLPYIGDNELNEIEEGIYSYVVSNAKERSIAADWSKPLFRQSYINHARTILTNLDPSSYINEEAQDDDTHIIARIAKGSVNAADIPFMRPEDFRPSAWNEIIEREIMREKSVSDYKEGAKTDMFKCFRCMKRECTYSSAQIRSADEPETIFITCINCGNKWRIG